MIADDHIPEKRFSTDSAALSLSAVPVVVVGARLGRRRLSARTAVCFILYTFPRRRIHTHTHTNGRRPVVYKYVDVFFSFGPVALTRIINTRAVDIPVCESFRFFLFSFKLLRVNVARWW